MNILMYVMTLILILASITYARLENFRSYSGVHAAFNHYMTSLERQPLDEMAEDWYHKIMFSSTSRGEKESKPNTSSSRLSFFTLINQKARLEHQEEHTEIRELAKKLMTDMYSEQKFFKEIKEQRPDFLDEILDEIEQSTEKSPKKFSKKADNLAKLEFVDKKLHGVFFMMLRGLPMPPKKEEVPSANFIKEATQESIVDTDDDKIHADESEESHSIPGYDSLIEHINIKNTVKIRVFLASRTLLTAIFGNTSLADEVITTRNDLYNRVKKDGYSIEDASNDFKQSFSNSNSAPSYEKILDFSVTKTNPKTYE